MKRALVATLLGFFSAVITLPVSATNVVNLIGLTANSVGMGGTGVSNFTTGTDALHKNPALLGLIPQDPSHFSIDGTGSVIQQPESGNYTNSFGSGSGNSLSGVVFSGDGAATYKVDDRFSVGLGFLPYGGAASDYTGQNAIFQPKNSLQLMRAVAAVSFRPLPWISVGAGPFFGWNRFALNESVAGALAGTNTQTTRTPSEATAWGGQFGVVVQPMANLTVGVSYLMRTSYLYKSLIAIDNFGPLVTQADTNPVNDFTLEQPDEIAAGVSYLPFPELTIAFDYRNIGWSRAEGYQEFGFATQNVVSIGGEYRWDMWRFRAGFNYAAKPLADITNEAGGTMTTLQGHTVYNSSLSLLDVFAFPGITTSHITAGVGYNFGPVDVNVAGVYAPSVSLTRSGTDVQGAAYNYTTSVSQWAVVLSATGRI
jgi:long-subunit fatty acid transport protein